MVVGLLAPGASVPEAQSVLVLVVAALAALVPSVRALRVDPVAAPRSD